MEIVFEPIMTTSPVERAELAQRIISDAFVAFQVGSLTREKVKKI